MTGTGTGTGTGKISSRHVRHGMSIGDKSRAERDRSLGNREEGGGRRAGIRRPALASRSESISRTRAATSQAIRVRLDRKFETSRARGGNKNACSRRNRIETKKKKTKNGKNI